MARNSALSSIHTQAAEKNASTRNSAECTGLRAVITRTRAQQHGGENVEEDGQKSHARVGRCAGPRDQRYRVGLLLGSDFLLVAVAHGQQHVLGEVQVAALFAVVFEDVGLDDRIDRAASSQKPQKMHLVRSMS